MREKPSPEKEKKPKKEDRKKRAPSQSASWERVPGRSQACSDVAEEPPRGTLRLKERPQTKVYWGFVTEEELWPAAVRETAFTARTGARTGEVQHLQTKHSFDWKDATWTARTAFGQMKDERKPAEPASPPQSRTATKSAARKRPKEEEETGPAKAEPKAEVSRHLPSQLQLSLAGRVGAAAGALQLGRWPSLGPGAQVLGASAQVLAPYNLHPKPYKLSTFNPKPET